MSLYKDELEGYIKVRYPHPLPPNSKFRPGTSYLRVPDPVEPDHTLSNDELIRHQKRKGYGRHSKRFQP